MSKILYIFDIDGTLADVVWRNIIAGPEPIRTDRKKYLRWLKRVQNKKMLLKDKPIPGMLELVKSVQKNAIYLTSRQESYRMVTEKWLKKHNFPNLPLYMRNKGNWHRAGKFKESVIFSIIKNKKVKVVFFDDDPKKDIARACKRNGWTFLKALSGS